MKAVAGTTHGLYNTETEACFIYHYNADNDNVGEKFNYSWGFKKCDDKAKVKANKDRVPCYSNYDTIFALCDHFNRALRHRSWPHKRGGRGVTGMNGRHHDFIVSAMLQNTFNAWHVIMQLDPAKVSFGAFCEELADEIYVHSQKYLVN